MVVEAPELQAYELKPAEAVRVTLEPRQVIAFAGVAAIVIVGKAFMVKLRFLVILHPAALVSVMMPAYVPEATLLGIEIVEIEPPPAFGVIGVAA